MVSGAFRNVSSPICCAEELGPLEAVLVRNPSYHVEQEVDIVDFS